MALKDKPPSTAINSTKPTKTVKLSDFQLPSTSVPKQQQQQQRQQKTRTARKSVCSKSCCIFSSMVPLVLGIFVLYIGAYLGTMTSEALKTENFTVSDALKQPPPQLHLANNLQAMAQVLSQPNQFMNKGKHQFRLFKNMLLDNCWINYTKTISSYLEIDIFQ